MAHTTTDADTAVADRFSPPAPRDMVAVLAFAGMVVAVLQTLLAPVIIDLPKHLDTGARQRLLGADVDTAVGSRRHADHEPTR